MKSQLFKVAPLILVTISIFFNLYGQKEVKTGDVVPDVELSTLNYVKPKVKLSDFRGKAVLIDFWATWCAPCIASFPKMDSLQKKFKNQLVILPVTEENPEVVNTFLQRLTKVKNLRPFSIVGEKVLSKMFPHMVLPHYVWLDKDQIVRALTDLDDITEANIAKFIHSGDVTELSLKNDPKPVKDPFASILEDTTVIEYKYFSKHIPGLTSAFGNTKKTIYVANGTILNLFQWAYGEGMKFHGGWSKIMLITKDSITFTHGPGTSQAFRFMWLKANSHNYMLKVPEADSSKMWEIMRRDIQGYFPFVSAKIVKEMRECYVLATIGSTTFQTTDTSGARYGNSPYNLFVYNGSMNLFVTLLRWAYQASDLQVIDETGYAGRVYINIETEVSKPGKLNAALAKYGLILKKEKRPVEILVVSDMRKK